MANVMFKRGAQANLPTGSSIKDGTFYLTTDTQRLFVGNGTSLIPLCETVQVKDNWAAVQTATAIEGQFYYAAAENILCIYKGGAWVQINPDTKITSLTTSVDKSGTTVTVTALFKDNKTDSFTHSYTFTEGNGVKFTVSGNTVKDIRIDANVDTLGVTDGSDNSATITLERSLEGLTDDSIVIKGADTHTLTVDASGDTITIAPVLGSSTNKEGLGVYGDDIASASNAFDNNGAFTTTLTKNSGDTIKSTGITPTITYGEDGSAVARFENGNAVLDVYTTGEIDDLFVGLNAMIYRGITADPSSLTGVHNGDLYLIKGADSSAGVTVGNEKAYNGDVVIAQGTEGADGTITGDVTWVVVPSANEIDSTFSLVAKTGNVIELQNQDKEGQGQFSVVGDDTNIDVSLSGTQFKVSHAGPGTGSALTPTAGSAVTQDPLGTKSFTAITGLQKDSFGHITGATSQTFTVQDTSVVKTTTTMTASTTDNSATIGVSTQAFNHGNEGVTAEADSIAVTSSTLTMSSATDGFAIDLTWGSF